MLKTSSMPKKTRREKLLSAERKKLKLLQQYEQALNTLNIPTSKKTAEATTSTAKKQQEIQLDEKDLDEKKFFLQDFRKSLMLIALIIALEIIVYFGTINNYFSFGS
jgi:hypothetical protein